MIDNLLFVAVIGYRNSLLRWHQCSGDGLSFIAFFDEIYYVTMLQMLDWSLHHLPL